MGEFFVKDFTGGAFVLFSPIHWAAILTIVLINMGLLALRRGPNPGPRKTVRYTLAAVLILNELAWHVWNAATGQWNIQTMLPLHVCSVFVYASAVMLVIFQPNGSSGSLSYRIYEFAYFLGIAGATQAILTPDLGIYGFPHFRYFQTFISHGGIVTAAIYMTTVEGYRPTWKSLGRVVVWSNVYMLFVGIVNALIGSNYMFIAHKPPTASLIDMLGPWPWYLLSLEAIGLVLFLLLYLPFAWRDFTTRRVAASGSV